MDVFSVFSSTCLNLVFSIQQTLLRRMLQFWEIPRGSKKGTPLIWSLFFIQKFNTYVLTNQNGQSHSFFSLFLLLFKYSCLHFPATTFSCPTHPHLPPSTLLPFGFVHGSFIHVPWQPFPFFHPLSPTPTPLWLMSVCSLFQCLWLYFAWLFVLLIRFHL